MRENILKAVLRFLIFSAISYILIFVGMILQEVSPQYVGPYAAMVVGLYITALYTAWEA